MQEIQESHGLPNHNPPEQLVLHGHVTDTSPLDAATSHILAAFTSTCALLGISEITKGYRILSSDNTEFIVLCHYFSIYSAPFSSNEARESLRVLFHSTRPIREASGGGNGMST